MRITTPQEREAGGRAATLMLTKWHDLLRDVVEDVCDDMNITDPDSMYEVQLQLEQALKAVRDNA